MKGERLKVKRVWKRRRRRRKRKIYLSWKGFLLGFSQTENSEAENGCRAVERAREWREGWRGSECLFCFTSSSSSSSPLPTFSFSFLVFLVRILNNSPLARSCVFERLWEWSQDTSFACTCPSRKHSTDDDNDGNHHEHHHDDDDHRRDDPMPRWPKPPGHK